MVGSKNSSNSVRLVEVSLEAGAKNAHLVDNACEVGGAASVPEILVKGVLAWLAERGFGEVQTVASASEYL